MTLTRDEKLTILKNWQASIRDELDKLVESTDGILEVEFWTPVYRLSSNYTQLASRAVGDKAGWLEWYQYSALFGTSDICGVYTQVGGDEKVKTEINTLEALLDIIEKI